MKDFQKKYYTINTYPDGTNYVTFNQKNDNRDYKYLFRLNNYNDLWLLNHFVDAHNQVHDFKPTITIPWLIDGQADRRFNSNESSGLKLVCKFLNNLNANFEIFHPHNSEVVEALIDNVKISDNSYFIKEVISEIYCKNNNIKRDKGLFYHNKPNDLTLMSPDAGGFKSLMKLCDKINWKGYTESAAKYRDPITSKLVQTIDRKDFKNKDILIVNDICVNGGTFKGLANLLRERNCGNLYLAVSHLTINTIDKNHVSEYFDKMFITNSVFNNYDFIENTNIKIIKVFNNE